MELSSTTIIGVPVAAERVEQGDLAADELQRRGRAALADQRDVVADDGDDVVAARAAATASAISVGSGSQG